MRIRVVHLLSNPLFQLVPVDRGQLGKIGPQAFGVADVDVLDLFLALFGIPVNEHPDAEGNTPHDRHLMTTQ